MDDVGFDNARQQNLLSVCPLYIHTDDYVCNSIDQDPALRVTQDAGALAAAAQAEAAARAAEVSALQAELEGERARAAAVEEAASAQTEAQSSSEEAALSLMRVRCFDDIPGLFQACAQVGRNHGRLRTSELRVAPAPGVM